MVEGVYILHTRRGCKVVGATIGVGVFARTIVATASRILECSVDVKTVGVGRVRPIESHTTAVDCVVCLLTHLGLVLRTVESVATSSVIFNAVILCRNARVGACAEIAPHTESLRRGGENLRKTVTVVVVAIAVATLGKDTDCCPAACRHKRCVERCGALHRTRESYGCGGVRHLCHTDFGLFGDDIDGSANGTRTIECRATTTHNLHSRNHICGQLLQTINSRQRGEERVRIDQNLGVFTIQTIDSHLWEATVLAGVLNPHTGLENQTTRK